MDTEASLLAAIREAPEDDAPRLVYMDWLLERGDPRGELLRVQLELEREPGPWARHALERREHELLELVPRTPKAIYRRGVCDGVEWDGREPFALAPFVRIRYPYSPGYSVVSDMRALAARTDVSLVRTLDLGNASDDAWHALLDSPLRPRRLVLPSRPTSIKPIAERGWLTNDDVAALVRAPLCSELEELVLRGAADETRLAALLAAPWAAQLRELSIGGVPPYGRPDALLHRIDYEIGAIGDAGVRAIVRSAPALRRLDLRWNLVGLDGVRALEESSLALTELRMTHDGLGADGIAALSQSRLAAITRVSIGHAPDPAVYRVLVTSAVWHEHALDLWSGDEADFDAVLEAVAEAPASPLAELRIYGIASAGALARFLGSPAAAALRHVAINARIKAAGARAIAAATHMPLESLVLERCDLGPGGITALVDAPHVQRVQHLCLRDCRIHEKGVRALATSALRPTELVLHDYCDFKSYLALLASPILERVADLQLYLKPRIVDTRALVKSLLDPARLPAIEKLWLPDLNDLADEHKRALARRYSGALLVPVSPS
jgi:uncharacterized protein (TIGR02996 family)